MKWQNDLIYDYDYKNIDKIVYKIILTKVPE